MLFDLTQTNPKEDWSYLTEGGASVVFTYIGLQHSVCSGKVLRVRKTLRHELTSSDLSEPPNMFSNYQEEDNEDASVVFSKSIISQLLPEHYLPDTQSVCVTNEWLSQLAVYAEPFRPAVRRQNSIDKNRRIAVLATNLVVNGLTIEIKPKWAFLPTPARLSPRTLPFKTNYCRFCMHRCYKNLDLDTSNHKDRFCPLDLFSGDSERIRKCLHSLWDSWLATEGEINNLRVFYDGKLIRPINSSVFEVLSRILLRTETASTPEIGSAFVENLLSRIIETDVFQTLRNLQRNLDPLDIEGLVQLWSLHRPNLTFGEGEPEPDILEWKEFVEVFQNRREYTFRQVLLAYLLSATFKDCSVIIRDPDESCRKVFVIDVGPKSIHRLKKWKELDENILSHFMRLSESGTKDPCIDLVKPIQ